MRTVLEDELLEEEEGLLVLDLLADLDGRLPRVRRVAALARVALLVLQDELDGEHLLELDAVEDLLLDGQLDAQAPRVRLSPARVKASGALRTAQSAARSQTREPSAPYKPRIDELDAREPRYLLQAHGEELARLELGSDPARAEVAPAAAALVQQDRLGDAVRDVDLGPQAVDAFVRGVGVHRDAANATQDFRHRALRGERLHPGIVKGEDRETLARKRRHAGGESCPRAGRENAVDSSEFRK